MEHILNIDILDNHPNRKDIKYTISDSGCWECNSHYASKGYPKIKIDGKQTSMIRVIYKAFVGILEDKSLVRHRCDNRLCINPEHLIKGTHSDNGYDAVERGLLVSKSGIEHYASKLTSLQVEEIRSSIGLTHSTLGRIYNVSKSTITKVRNKSSYKNV